MSDYQAEVKKLLDFTENVLIDLLNNKESSQNAQLQRAMIEYKLRKSSRDHSKFQKLIKRRQLHKVPLDVVKEEVMEYKDILPFQRLSKYFSYYTDADRMDQIEFDNRVSSYMKSNQKFEFKSANRTEIPRVTKMNIPSRGNQVPNKPLNTKNNVALNNNLSRLQKTQEISVSNNHVNKPVLNALPTKPVGSQSVKILKEKVEIKDNEVKNNDPAIIIKQQPTTVTSSTNTVKSINQTSSINTNLASTNGDKTNKLEEKEDNCVEIVKSAYAGSSGEKKPILINNMDKQSGKINSSKNNKLNEDLIELESTEVISISSKAGSVDNSFEKGQSIKLIEEIVEPRNKELESKNIIKNNGLDYSPKLPNDESRNSDKTINKDLKSPDRIANKEVERLDNIPDKEIDKKEQNIILIEEENIKKPEEKQGIATINIKTDDKPVSKSPTKEDKKSADKIDTNQSSINFSSNEVGNEKLTDNIERSSESDSNQPKIGDKSKAKTTDVPRSHKKSKGNTNIKKRNNNNNGNNTNNSISNKIENLIERIQNSKITLETLLGPVSNETIFEQFHKVEPPSPKAFEKENKNKDGHNIRLIQLYDSITKSDESDEDSADSVKEEIHTNDSQQMNNKNSNDTISSISDNDDNDDDNDTINKVSTIWNNMTTDENNSEENIPLNQPTSNANQSLYDAYMSSHNDGLPLPTTVKNFSDNDFKFKSILFGNENCKNVLSSKNPFITSYQTKQKINVSSSAKPTECVVNKKVPKALKKMSSLVSKYNLDDS